MRDPGGAPPPRPRVLLVIGAVLLLSGCLGEPYDTGASSGTASSSHSSQASAEDLSGLDTAPAPAVPASPTSREEAARVLARARETVRSWHSVRARGTLNRDGVAMAFDLAGTRDGRQLHGTVSVGAGKPVEVLRVGALSYARTSTARHGHRYVRMSGDPWAPLDLQAVMASVDRTLAAADDSRAEAVDSFEGRPAVRVVGPGPSSLVVAADGTGQPLRLMTGEGADVSTISFDSWDQVRTLSTPAAADLASVPGS